MTTPRASGVTRSRDRGAVDVSIEMLFGLVLVLAVMFALFEATVYWHSRNVFDDAAAEGARVAAAYDGTCATGIAAARHELRQRASSWAAGAVVTCTDGPLVTVRIAGPTAGATGVRASVSEQAPRER